jgi:hypothetical protein
VRLSVAPTRRATGAPSRPVRSGPHHKLSANRHGENRRRKAAEVGRRTQLHLLASKVALPTDVAAVELAAVWAAQSNTRRAGAEPPWGMARVGYGDIV